MSFKNVKKKKIFSMKDMPSGSKSTLILFNNILVYNEKESNRRTTNMFYSIH